MIPRGAKIVLIAGLLALAVEIVGLSVSMPFSKPAELTPEPEPNYKHWALRISDLGRFEVSAADLKGLRTTDLSAIYYGVGTYPMREPRTFEFWSDTSAVTRGGVLWSGLDEWQNLNIYSVDGKMFALATPHAYEALEPTLYLPATYEMQKRRSFFPPPAKMGKKQWQLGDTTFAVLKASEEPIISLEALARELGVPVNKLAALGIAEDERLGLAGWK